jgi:hypothetical protein
MVRFEIGVATELVGIGLAIYGLLNRDAYAIGTGVALGYIGNNIARHDLEIDRTKVLEAGKLEKKTKEE